jgi:flagellar assembly factor FliW
MTKLKSKINTRDKMQLSLQFINGNKLIMRIQDLTHNLERTTTFNIGPICFNSKKERSHED